MLELTRKVGESVVLRHARIDRTVTLSVLALLPGTARVRFEGPSLDLVAELQTRDAAYEFQIGGHHCHLHLLSVIRGEARLGFDAPREIDIQRSEREATS